MALVTEMNTNEIKILTFILTIAIKNNRPANFNEF